MVSFGSWLIYPIRLIRVIRGFFFSPQKMGADVQKTGIDTQNTGIDLSCFNKESIIISAGNTKNRI